MHGPCDGGLSLAVVGADFPNQRGPGRRFEIALCPPGEPVRLVPEPKNPADPRAIAVYSTRGVQIGYIRAERAQLIGSYIARGRLTAAVFQEKTEYGAVIRLGLDGRPPVLPARRGADHAPDESGFVPDFLPPDDWTA